MLAFGAEEHLWRPVVELLDRTRSAPGTVVGAGPHPSVGVLLSFLTRTPFDDLPLWSDVRKQPLAKSPCRNSRRPAKL